MKRIWFIISIAATLTGLVVCSGTPDTGWLRINTDPAGASVFINDSLVDAETDCVLGDIPESEHVVRLELEGYSTHQQQIEVLGGDTAEIDVSLSEAYGILCISSTPEGAEIWIDSVNTGGTTPCQFNNIAAGEHALRLSSEGYFDWEAVVSIKDKDTIQIDAALAIREGILKWKYKGEDGFTAPALGSDGKIYVSCVNKTLYAFNPDGSLAWGYYLGNIIYSPNTPAIGPEGNVYVTYYEGMSAVDPSGSPLWKFSYTYCGLPAIAVDGTVYVGSTHDYTLYALNTEGDVIWSYEAEGYVNTPPVIDHQGNIYFGGSDGFIYSLNPDGSLRWRYETGSQHCLLVIGSDDAVYVGATSFTGSKYIALNPGGSLKWEFETAGSVFNGSTIGPGEVIYTKLRGRRIIDAVSSDGVHLWEFDAFSTGSSNYGYVVYPPTIGSYGTLYISAGWHHMYFDSYCCIYALDTDGRLKWRFEVGAGLPTSSVLAEDGTLYFSATDGYLYALQTDSYGLASSGWPALRHDNANSGRADGP